MFYCFCSNAIVNCASIHPFRLNRYIRILPEHISNLQNYTCCIRIGLLGCESYFELMNRICLALSSHLKPLYISTFLSLSYCRYVSSASLSACTFTFSYHSILSTSFVLYLYDLYNSHILEKHNYHLQSGVKFNSSGIC